MFNTNMSKFFFLLIFLFAVIRGMKSHSSYNLFTFHSVNSISLIVQSVVKIMVLILDGNSLTGVHVKRNLCYSTGLRHLGS